MANLIKQLSIGHQPIGTAEAAPVSLGGNQFSYPRLGISAPLTISPQTDPTVLSDWSQIRSNLYHGVDVTFSNTDFTQAPLAFVIGHSSDVFPHRFSSVFLMLNQSQIGDQIYLRDQQTTYQFTVTNKQIIDPTHLDQFKALAPSDPTKQRIALVTCWPPFTTKDRLVVLAERSR